MTQDKNTSTNPTTKDRTKTYNGFSEKRLNKLGRIVRESTGICYILMTQIDPDALGAACGLAEIFTEMGATNTLLVYCGQIGHPQNRAIFHQFKLAGRSIPVSAYLSRKEEQGLLALVDSSQQEDRRLPEELRPLTPHIVFDHHQGSDFGGEGKKAKKGEFFSVEEVGATSTLVIELGRALGHDFSKETATMLALGVYNDTKTLINAGDRDREAYAWVTQTVNPLAFNQLIDYSLPASHYLNLLYALNHMEEKDNRIIANAGTIAPEDADDISSIADYLIRREGIHLVLVWGVVEGKIRVSARSSDLTTDLQEFLVQRFGQSAGAKICPYGRGEGGALLDIDLGFWISSSSKNLIEELVMNKMRELVFNQKEKPPQEPPSK